MLIAVLNIIKTIKYSEFDQLIPGETISLLINQLQFPMNMLEG